MNKRGFTLIEVMLSSAIFTVVAGIALSFSVAASKQVELNTTWASVLTGEVQLIEKIEEELASSSVNYVGEDLGEELVNDSIVVNANSVSFRKVIGYNPNTYNVVWSDFITYQLAPNRGEIGGDGIDNNDNGYVDEMCFERIDSGGSGFLSTRVLFDDPYKLQFVINTNLLTIHLNYFTSHDTMTTKTINIALPSM